MARRRPVLTAVVYVAVTVVVLVLGGAFVSTSLLRGEVEHVVVRVGGAMLLLGLAWLVVKAMRSRVRGRD
ncbi:hypothetical protein [Dactylosporangium sp. CS-033363]|uniref:hypothetical protein n=1 Tax=Dactylosporangium sp. CS-033363 TaxID=3239935 RepID=UPI003D8FDEBB